MLIQPFYPDMLPPWPASMKQSAMVITERSRENKNIRHNDTMNMFRENCSLNLKKYTFLIEAMSEI
jgi:hypothetical protein